ncbi:MULTISPECIES: 16S rRNA (cytosine(967)-C(5))-methyltransferase [Prochlorococcus]|uniref:16S rRNA (cytosine(967)-C(5))-methyltransferase n=1 Tax=Prochlorococcus marinus (strain SARG / CCMP1375 / SS120) TaxID=167539 RepID=Q7TVA8_PROMA|nr:MULTISPECIES: 16S rRNA (cytosine(967)-C(5))-methyltransferase [Prochlorococcus]AAP99468.1 tRNA and rRNA cytosine-C5-methylase [Prochlorococcus marinus subsp. marinus str. CCMP1375]KGG11263.1 Ribosomal RNA small subunit methyltransferase B [Prochlorococcus marinus str. LG]KGG21602.1 Ribosomal RNA small subunit methyltransferase B [Prochlorococcus marinus str. SS2]KGG23056.1 Ribosomal RNA small subunit methyltransferase B [Prochlorococcus marinus str. SS35]KGG33763.1 Ribosomal RNA small subun
MLKKGLLSRLAAWEILQTVGRGAYSDIAIDHSFRKYSLSIADRALATELACGAIRQRLVLDCWIDCLAKVSAEKQPPLLRWLLHVGLYQIFYMDRIPVSAAVNTTVELAKKKNLKSLAPVVNAILREAIRARDLGKELPGLIEPQDRLSLKHSIPTWLAYELIEWKGEKGAEIIAKAFNQAPAIDLRVNSKRSSVKSLRQKFQDSGIESKLIETCPYGLTVTSGAGDLRQWPGYEQGEWSVQDRSAQWVVPLLEPRSGEVVLDACSAPGGKTTHLAELMNDIGEIWAVDRSPKRLQKVSLNAARLGHHCIKFLSADATNLIELKPSWKGYFNKILLDVPCSGLGTLARNPDARWRMSPSQIEGLIQLQFNLLEGILPLLKPGGRIVYSTCTIHPDENFRQIEKFVSMHQPLNLERQKQIWPGDAQGGDGFYAAIIDSG